MIAKKYQYEFVLSGGFILFIKNPSTLTKIAAKILLKDFFVRLLKSIVVFLPTPGVWQDHLYQVEKSKQVER